MRNSLIIAAVVFLFQFSKGQDTIRRFEFGSTLLTVNSFNSTYYSAPDRPSFEIINGVFFRYTKKRFGLRLHASYTTNSSTFASPATAMDGSSGDNTTRDFRIGLGGQYSLSKRKDRFYTFLDLSYRNVFSTGHYYGGISGASNILSLSSNGLDANLGIGLKIKVLKNVLLSPEFGYLIATKFTHEISTSMRTGQSMKNHNIDVNIHQVIKLHATVKF